MKDPLVSVYVVNHNYGRFLKQSVESVLAQDYNNYELIIIDDGSTDDSHLLLDEYEQIAGINVIRQNNKGLIATNNIALRMSKGKYVMRVDADDFLEPEALKIMCSILEANEEFALIFPDYWEVDEDGMTIKKVCRHNFDEEVTLYDMPAHGACTMIRRDILLEIGGYDEDFTCHDGYDLWLSVIKQYKVTNVNIPLFYYRQHANSLTHDDSKLLETRASIIEKHVEKLGNKPLNVLAVIPVRGSVLDTRSIPLEKLGQKRLIDWTLNAALGSNSVNSVIVTTPDQEVLNYVNDNYGNRVILNKRSSELARINLDLHKTLMWILDEMAENEKPDAIVLLNIESPFRSSMYVTKAINAMQLYDVDVVIGVRMDDDMFYIHDGGGLQPRAEEELRLESDFLYRKVGGITLLRRSFFEKEGKIIGGSVGHVVLDQKSAFTIKSKIDWQIAKALID
ncbi:MAG: glycosyl transferase [Chloroflexi bacterium]|nr:glycosyl transferase [Chloroflexota bacterium]